MASRKRTTGHIRETAAFDQKRATVGQRPPAVNCCEAPSATVGDCGSMGALHRGRAGQCQAKSQAKDPASEPTAAALGPAPERLEIGCDAQPAKAHDVIRTGHADMRQLMTPVAFPVGSNGLLD